MKGLAGRNTNVKYESPSTYQSKVMSKVRVLEKVKDQRVNVMVSNERSFQKEYTCEIYESPSTYQCKVLTKVNSSKKGQTPRSKIRGSRSWYQMKGLARRNTHVNYESPSTY
jgi:hypothetical protein